MAAAVVSIINLKGGVGKSTLAMILGEWLAFRYSKNVLLIDMDAQANLSYCMVPESEIQRQEREKRTTYDLFMEALAGEPLDISHYITRPPLVVSNIARSGMSQHSTLLHMVVSTPSVAQLDEELLRLWESNKPVPNRLRQSLTDALAPAREQYHYILIDCPPGLSIFSSTALIASDYYIVPVIPEPLSLQGVGLVQQRATQIRQRYGSPVEFKGTVLNIVKTNRKTHQRISGDMYGADSVTYIPFDYWLPDNERLRRLGEFDPDLQGTWAGGVGQKFRDHYDKYSLSYRLSNPASGPLSRRGIEGPQYQLTDRIANVVEEFQLRCQP